MTSESIDWSRPIQTRNGRPARVLATDLKDDTYPVVVVIQCDNGAESVETSTACGKLLSKDDSPYFINVPEPPEKVLRWVSLCRSSSGDWCESYNRAECAFNPLAIARRRVEFVVGEFEE